MAERWGDHDDELRRLWEAGVPVAEIARRLGRTAHAVMDRAANLKLPRRRGGWRPNAGAKPAHHRGPNARLTTRRDCLCCGRPFASTGIHNRLCAACREPTGLPAGWL